MAFAVPMHSFINKGLAAAGVLTKFSPAFQSLTALGLLPQVPMIALGIRLAHRHFGRPAAPAPAIPAE